MRRYFLYLSVLMVWSVPAFSQTMIDYNTQIRNKPITSGTVVPSSCSIAGNQFYLTTTDTLYICDGSHYQPGSNPGSTVFNVKAFGAVGDDTGDQTAAFNATYAAAVAAGGGTIFMPCGTYRLTGTFTIHSQLVNFEGENESCALIHHVPATFIPGVVIQMSPFSVEPAGYYGKFGIVGTATGSAGLQTGCIVGAVFQQIFATGYTGASAAGIRVQDRLDCFPDNGGAWTERNTWDNVWAGGVPTSIYPTDPYNTTGWIFETVGSPSNTSFGYNRFLNVSANAHSGQIGFWFKTGVFMYNTSFTSTCNMDDGASFTSPPTCIQSDGNVAENEYMVTGEYSGAHTAQSVHVTASGNFWGWGTVNILSPGGVITPGVYDGAAKQQQVARVTSLNTSQSWDTGTATIGGTPVTPQIIAADNAGIMNFGYFSGNSISSPFISIFDSANNTFSLCALGFGDATNVCANPLNQVLRMDPRTGLKIAARSVGVDNPATGLIPSVGSSNGFQFGLGVNCAWDGTNWRLKTDGTNNGGACWIGTYGTEAGMKLYTVPSQGPGGSGATDRVLSAAALQNLLVFKSTPKGTIAQNPIVNDTTKYNPVLDISGTHVTDSAGLQVMNLEASGGDSGGNHYNEQINLGDPNWSSGFGSSQGTNVAHPLAWSYSADSIAFDWFSKTFNTPISGTPIMQLLTTGHLNVTGGYNVGGTAGLTQTISVTGGGGGACNLVFTGGILTSTSCP
jgi:hypothetical protein